MTNIIASANRVKYVVFDASGRPGQGFGRINMRRFLSPSLVVVGKGLDRKRARTIMIGSQQDGSTV